MLNFFFAVLLLANAGLLAYQQGFLDTFFSSGREPGRVANQINADKIKLLPAAGATGASASSIPSAASAAPAAPAVTPVPDPAVAPPPAATAKSSAAQACTEIGNFSADEARRFEARLASLALGDRVSQRGVREVLTHMVYIPPQADREAAERKAAELRGLGVTDFYIIQDNSSMRWAISLGVFKFEEMARAHLANLSQRGVRSARIGVRSMTAKMVAFQLRGLEPGMTAAVGKILTDFPKQEMRSCEAAGA